MSKYAELDNVIISMKSRRLLKRILVEQPRLARILEAAEGPSEATRGIRRWAVDLLKSSPVATSFYEAEHVHGVSVSELSWQDLATIRVLDYADNAGKAFKDLNLRNEEVVSHPFGTLFRACRYGTGGGTPAFFEDMRQLFRQLTGLQQEPSPPARATVEAWMQRFPSGLEPAVVKMREANRDRIVEVIIDQLDSGEKSDSKYRFEPGMRREAKREKVLEWWNESLFHLRFAVRSPEMLDEMLDRSLDPETMSLLLAARDKGIPFFVNPYYLSLLNVRAPELAAGADQAIRDYVLYSRDLVDEFGHIVAWEKEDLVQPGKPNVAGWILPSHHNVHRRYPEVAILIPDSMGRACAGLCASCQRMYDFQSGYLNFDLEKLTPTTTWKERLAALMNYFEEDSQLRDILITGGDALMSSNRTLQGLLEAVYAMALRKREANAGRPDGEKYAEMVRIRLGTRLPVYLPQRITPVLAEILAGFKAKASRIGMKQFVIQTHFESPMEVTPESERAIGLLLSSGWTITNQLVFTASASRRGHTAKLRKVLNDVGVLPYYTFSTKGYGENRHSFAPNARSVQEQVEERRVGEIPEVFLPAVEEFPLHAEELVVRINAVRSDAKLPFLATDRNVLNLPGVGKSLTFRVIGITYDGRRILEFDHDPTRRHSPIIDKLGKVIVIESKSIHTYLLQLGEMGEDPSEYEGLYGYSIGQTAPRAPLYEYPAYAFDVTDDFTNLELSGA